MGSIEGQTLGTERARQLLRRTGFGARPAEVATYATLEAGVAVDRLLDFKPSRFKPSGSGRAGRVKQHDGWIRYMIGQKPPEALREKLVLFWHDHFATAISKVVDATLMGVQNRTLRQHCAGDMKVLVKAMHVDPAMLQWLDTVRNLKAISNENYAREFLELFTLGVFDLAGNPNYTQDDVVQIARAFTGHTYGGRRQLHAFDADEHDTTTEFPARGPKVIFQSTGGFGPGGRDYLTVPAAIDELDAAQAQHEIDQVTDIVFAHRDTDAKSTVARRTAARLFEFFAHGGFAHPSPALIAVVDDVLARSGFGQGANPDWSIRGLVREILLDEELYASLADATKKSVKWPVDFYAGTIRVLQLKLLGRDARVGGQFHRSSYEQLADMGQTVFDPPSVFGWEWEAGWVSSKTLLARYAFAVDAITARSVGGLDPGKLMDLGLSDPGQIVDAVTELLGVRTVLSVAERDVLVDYLGTGPLDLADADTRNEKLHGLIGLVLQSPAYQLH